MNKQYVTQVAVDEFIQNLNVHTYIVSFVDFDNAKWIAKWKLLLAGLISPHL